MNSYTGFFGSPFSFLRISSVMAHTLIHQRVEAARAGDLPVVIGRMASGWAVMGDRQVMLGYCLLLPDPVVTDLNALRGDARSGFLQDMARLGDAVLDVTDAARINYEILGNLEPALHAHVVPRYTSEPDDLRTRPIWSYDWNAAPAYDEQLHGEVREGIARSLRANGALAD